MSKGLHPGYPVIEGDYQLTANWVFRLPGEFNRRMEGEDLVIWRPGLTLWIDAWGDEEATPEETVAWVKTIIDPRGRDVIEEHDGALHRLSYRLDEEADDERVPAFYAFVVGSPGYLQIAMYFDQEDELATAQQIWRSVRETTSSSE